MYCFSESALVIFAPPAAYDVWLLACHHSLLLGASAASFLLAFSVRKFALVLPWRAILTLFFAVRAPRCCLSSSKTHPYQRFEYKLFAADFCAYKILIKWFGYSAFLLTTHFLYHPCPCCTIFVTKSGNTVSSIIFNVCDQPFLRRLSDTTSKRDP